MSPRFSGYHCALFLIALSCGDEPNTTQLSSRTPPSSASAGAASGQGPGGQGEAGHEASGVGGAAGKEGGGVDGPQLAIHVSGKSGDDAHSGLSPAEAKKTIQAGIEAALGAGIRLVKICDENCNYTLSSTLEIPDGVVLEGGYDCHDGYFSALPSEIDASHACNAPQPIGSGVLRGEGAIFDAGAPVVSFRGKNSSVMKNLRIKGPRFAVKVDDGASPEISGCEISVEGPPGQLESIALHVRGSLAAIKANCIEGGEGQVVLPEIKQPLNSRTLAGSVGVLLEDDKGSSVLDCFIKGGSGKASADSNARGSIGLFIQGAVPGTISRNTINGGYGEASTFAQVGSTGVLFYHKTPETAMEEAIFEENEIDGGNGEHIASTGPGDGGIGSIGVDVDEDELSPLRFKVKRSFVSGGKGRNDSDKFATSIGIRFSLGMHHAEIEDLHHHRGPAVL